jgi:stearoyl-CoA desaturase (delta-9 desaturase)
MFVLSLMIIHWYGSLFCHTLFLHRYASHKMFKLSPFWQNFFYVLTIIAQGPSFLNPRAYAILHKRHHAYSDTDNDPHSPVFQPNIFKMMLITYKEYSQILKDPCVGKDEIQNKYLDKIGDSNWLRISFVVGYILIYISFAPSLWYLPMVIFHSILSPIQGAVVNYFGHKVGYVNHNNGDNSKNTLFFDFLMLGELFQNNHHHAPHKPNFAFKFFEFDPTYFIIVILQKLRIIKIKNLDS